MNNCFVSLITISKTGISIVVYFCRESKKEYAYNITLGGSSPLGTFGYIEQFQEMIDQVIDINLSLTYVILAYCALLLIYSLEYNGVEV